MKIYEKTVTPASSDQLAGTGLAFLAEVHDLDTGDWHLRVQFFLSGDKGIGATLVDRKLLGEPREIAKALWRKGAALTSDTKAASVLVQKAWDAFMQAPQPTETITRRTGFADSGNFVLPHRTIGPRAGELIFEASQATPPARSLVQGALADWQKGLKRPCRRSSFLTFCVAVPFGGALLELIGEDEGALFHFVGESSTGKSLAGRAGASALGRAQKNDLATFAMTDRAREEYCAASNDLAVFIDEFGRLKGSARKKVELASQIAYDIPGGVGEIRSEYATRNRSLKNLTWKALGCSSGEVSLDESTSRLRGEQVRLIEVPVPDVTEYGVFDRLPSDISNRSARAAKLAEKVEAAISANYGVAIPAYVERLLPIREQVGAEARKLVQDFVNSIGSHASSWEARFAKKFAIVLAGGVMAARLGVAPCSENHVKGCVRRLHAIARRRLFTPEEAVADFARRMLGAIDSGRFPRMKKGQQLSISQRKRALGVRRTIRGAPCAAIRISELARFVDRRLVDGVVTQIDSAGLLIRGQDGKTTRQLVVKGFNAANRARFFVIRLKPLRTLAREIT